ncbi:DUF2480 family protein [Chitinophaga rhizophila]|uniref:DUF2480 family protein n=1 Tax=Chitinophaga rhizophila TaxID=2866212 RepID=A0ABS7GBX3_9BACT|nr:DUF2480 family protein [Chitinophaga rhizophila]MBW8684635.1 DUF2480 family protein [Chitinophaga rhizophila]
MSSDMPVNKLDASGIVAFDLIDYKPDLEVVVFDIREHLYMEMIIKEKEFRESVGKMDYTAFHGKAVAVICSVDAIIPPWVYMIIGERLHAYAAYLSFKDPVELETELWAMNVNNVDLSAYKDQKVVVRARAGIPPALYMLAAKRLAPFVKTLMYGEVGMPKVIYKK